MKKILVLLAALIMVFSVTACGSIEPSADGSDAKMINVAIEIDYPDDSEKEDIQASMIVEAGTSAIDQLYSFTDDNNIDVVLDESSPTIYVTSIGGVDQTADAGWVYEVNDEMTMDAADELILEEGTKISWEYTSWDDM